ncbi:Nif3-like dinuclear metal center hexameric protein [candidate division WOR-3 bacterium]|nr:Nif3-like dinuclear metal center hexameric protein [candidate division WOR-3 bacterium]
MKAKELEGFFRNISPHVFLRETCDGFKFGEPKIEIKAIGVTWMATNKVIKESIRRNINCIITHEPIFYCEDTDIKNLKVVWQEKAFKEKIRLLSDNNIVVYRAHDSWDTFKKYGILDSWAAVLGLNKVVAEDGYHKIYKIPKKPLKNIALEIKAKMKNQSIRVAGNLNKEVSKIGLGVGAWGTMFNLKSCMHMRADLFITGETTEWDVVRFAIDSGIAMIVVGHINSENFGMANMAEYLREHLDTPITFFDAGEIYSYL